MSTATHTPPIPHSQGYLVNLGLPNCGWITLRTALDLFQRLEGVLAEADWPRLTTVRRCVTDDVDPEGYEDRFVCPWQDCGREFDEPRAYDVSWRFTSLDVDWDKCTVSSWYDSLAPFELFAYCCPECAMPVRLPDGFKEVEP